MLSSDINFNYSWLRESTPDCQILMTVKYLLKYTPDSEVPVVNTHVSEKSTW